jgi:transcriptional regulator with XRE-family HTH domain
MAGLYEHIATQIRQLRTTFGGRGISQEALAEKLETAANTVSRWETATYRPSAEELNQLARFFRVPITVFFPDMSSPDQEAQALLSALGDLDEEDRREVIAYAQFRKARKALGRERGRRRSSTK